MNRLEIIAEYPVKKRIASEKPNPHDVKEFWANVFTKFANTYSNINYDALDGIRYFSAPELDLAISQLKNNKVADRVGIIAEMIKYGPHILHKHLLKFFNDILSNKYMIDEWLITFFTLIPKQGCLKQVAN